MDELPELALIELFNSLPVYDQLKIRNVCKRWRAIIESSLSYRKELVLFYRSRTRPLVWFYSDRPVNPHSSLIVNEEFKKSPLFKRLFQGIKRLYLICRLKELLKSNFINFVNRFRHLEHLQVNTLADPEFGFLPRKLKIRFNLPNLRSFCYHNTKGETKILQLDCPKLESFSVPYDFRLDEKYASFKESLKFLRVNSFECAPGFELPNLEVLSCQKVRPIDISAHQKLKEIHYFYEHLNFGYNHSYETVLEIVNGLFEQKRRLKRSELQVYHRGLKCTPGGNIFKQLEIPRCLPKSDLTLLRHNSENFKLDRVHWRFWYTRELDEEIAAFDAEQAEKLARCLTDVTLGDTLSAELNGKFKIFFSYVQSIYFSKDIHTQSDLDRLPDLFPHLIVFKQAYWYGMDSAFRNPSAYPNDFGEGPLNFRFLAKFKALQKLESWNWRISLDELKAILKSCRFLEEADLLSAKLVDRQKRAKFARFQIFLSKNEFKAASFQWEYLVGDYKQIRKQEYPGETFYSAEALVNCLDQRGYLRNRKAISLE